MNNISIGVVVPVYNVPSQFLNKCLTSLKEQKYENAEYIIIDDGSTNDSGKICDEYAKEDKRFKVIHQSNAGLSSTRNTGVEHVKSDWFMFLDGDDYLEKNSIEELSEIIKNDLTEKNDYEVLCFGLIRRYQNYSEKFIYNNEFDDGKVYTSEEMLLSVLNFKCQLGDATAKLYKTNFIKKNNIKHDFEVRQGIEALLFCTSLFLSNAKAKFISKYYYNYIYNNNSITIKDSDSNQKYIYLGFEKIKRILFDNSVSDLIKNMYYNRILYIICGAAISVYFSPNNCERYSIKKKKFKKYLSNPIIKEGLEKGKTKDLDFKRKVIIRLIKCRIFFLFPFLGVIRKKQKEK